MSYSVDRETDELLNDRYIIDAARKMSDESCYDNEPTSEVYDIGNDLPMVVQMPIGFAAASYDFVSSLEDAAGNGWYHLPTSGLYCNYEDDDEYLFAVPLSNGFWVIHFSYDEYAEREYWERGEYEREKFAEAHPAPIEEPEPNVVHWNVSRNSPVVSYSYVYDDEEQRAITVAFIERIVNSEFDQLAFELEGGCKLIRIWDDEGDETLIYMDIDGWRYVDTFDGLWVEYQH